MANTSLPIIDKVETGENIKRLMRLKKMSAIQLQTALNMPSAILIYNWCRGVHIPSTEYLLQMSRIFGCSIEEIIIVKEN